ncbi:MAG: glycosyltransferase family 39 protein [Bacteroidales bacterium]|nr:glycosyltransferase family 39 protein [Bacteroidales bacterium]
MKFKISLNSPENILGIALTILSVIYILSIFTRYPNGDEGLQAEHAYFLSELNYVKSNIWAGYEFGWDVHQYHYHKGLVLLGAAVIKTIGYSLPAFRLISVLFYLLLVFYLYKYFKSLEYERWQLFFLLTLLTLLVSTIFYDYMFIFRPEALFVTLGFASYYHMHIGLKNNSAKQIIFSGIFAGLAAFTHLIALVFIAAGGITLLIRRQFKYAIIFGVFAILALGLYFYDLLSKEAFNGFIYQFTNEASIAEKQEEPVQSIFSEHMRFFNSEKESMFSILFFLSLGFNFRFLRKNFGLLLTYGITSMICLAILAHSYTNKYALIYYPFMAFVIALSLARLPDYKKTYRIAFIVLFTVYAGYHLYSNYRIISRPLNVSERNREIVRSLGEKNVNVCAFSTLVFNEIENYTIHGLLAFYRYYTKNYSGYERTVEDFFNFCDRLDDKYVIIDRLVMKNRFYDFVEDENIQEGDVLNNFELIKIGNSYYIFKNLRLDQS